MVNGVADGAHSEHWKNPGEGSGPPELQFGSICKMPEKAQHIGLTRPGKTGAPRSAISPRHVLGKDWKRLSVIIIIIFIFIFYQRHGKTILLVVVLLPLLTTTTKNYYCPRESIASISTTTTKSKNIVQSMWSSETKLSCIKTELKRCTDDRESLE